jgi:hypothetical protein
VVHASSPNTAYPGLHWKPLDATIGRLLAPYCPGGCQGNNQQNDNAKYPPFAGHINTILSASPDRGGSWLFEKPLDTTIGQPLAPRSDSINLTCIPLILGAYFIVKSLKKGSSCPNINRGMTHQSDEEYLNNMAEYFVGVVKLALYCDNTQFLLRVINQ